MLLRTIIALILIIACSVIGNFIHIGSGNGTIIGFIVGFLLGCVVFSYRISNKEVSLKDVEMGKVHAHSYNFNGPSTH